MQKAIFKHALKDNQLSEIRNQEIGFIFQGFNLIANLDALENVELPLIYREIGKNERHRLAEAAILTIVGGITGILLGLLGAFGACSLMSASMGSAIRPGIRASTILGATLFPAALAYFLGFTLQGRRRSLALLRLCGGISGAALP